MQIFQYLDDCCITLLGNGLKMQEFLIILGPNLISSLRSLNADLFLYTITARLIE
jgi:hypothetical protein